MDDSDTVLEADGAMAQICIRLAGLLTTSDPDVTLGCDVTATMEIDGGLLASTLIVVMVVIFCFSV